MAFKRERFLHSQAMNRGILLTPFHNMVLVLPATSVANVDLYTEIFCGVARTLAGQGSAEEP